MKERDVYRCLLSYGFYPMTLVLKDLEKEDRFEECNFILEAMNSYKEKIKLDDIVEISTKWSEDYKKEYYTYFGWEIELIENNLNYYIKDIKNRLKL